MQKPILVIGDLLEDWWWRGDVKRLNPEYPSPLVDIYDGYPVMTPGGAGNVNAILNCMGLKTIAVFGKHSPAKHRLLVGDHEIARWDVSDYSTPVDLSAVEEALKVCGTVVVVDYGKGAVCDRLLDVLISVDQPVLLSTKKSPEMWLDIADALFANRQEYLSFQQIYDYHQFSVITLGSKGVELRKYGSVVASCPSLAMFVRSVCGAGDAVLAACASWWHKRGRPVSDNAVMAMLNMAMREAAAVVESEAGKFLEQASGKLMTIEEEVECA